MAIVKKISELVPKGSNLGNTDLLIVGVDNGFDYDLKSVTGAQLLGTVVSQTITNGVTSKAPSEDVVYDNLALKVDKVTGKGLSTEDYTSAEKTKLSGLTGTNTGDQTLQSVTDKGNTTTNDIIVNGTNVQAEILPSIIRSSNDINKSASLTSDGRLLLNTNGVNTCDLRALNTTGDVVLDFPNKATGFYTIATTADIASKLDSNIAITGATKTKITYDSKGLVTSGADATTADIADSLNKRYVTDANLTTIGNTSGTNTGDETVTTIKTKLGITTLSGTNTGDQDLSGLMVKSNNLSDLTNTTTARSNLGLGSLATQSGTFSGTSSGTNTGDQTFLNARVQSVTSSATVTPISTNDEVIITAQAVGLTLANPTGTFTEGQAFIIRVKDNGTAQTIAYGTNYRGTTLPTTTTVGTTTYIPLIYNATDGKFDNVSASGVLNTIPWFQTIACSDLTTALTAGTTKAYFNCPYAVTLTSVSASVLTAPTGATLLTVDINENGTSVLSTKLTFDASELTTTTATTPAVISDSSLALDSIISIDIDSVGSTVAGAGLLVTLKGTITL